MKKITVILSAASLLFLSSCSKHNETPAAQIIYSTDFSKDDGKWADAVNSTCCKFTSGYYSVREEKAGYLQYAGPLLSDSIRTAYLLSVKATNVLDDPSQVAYTAIVYDRYNTNNLSVFRVSTTGTFDLQYKRNGVYQIEQTFIPSAAILTGSGALNTIAVHRTDTFTELIVNGKVIFTKQDTRPVAVTVAVGVCTSGTAFTPAEVHFDDLSITVSK